MNIVYHIIVIFKVLLHWRTREQYFILHLENGPLRLMLNDIGAATRLYHINIEKQWILNVQRNVLEVELFCRGYARIFISHHRHNDFMPIIRIMLVLFLFNHVWLLFIHRLPILPQANLPNTSLPSRYRHEIRPVLVILLQECQQTAHFLRFPVGEGARDHWQTIVKVRSINQFPLTVLQGPRIVLYGLPVLVRGDLTDSRLPEKDCQRRLVAKPALISSVSVDAPLRAARDKIFVANIALNDQLLRVKVLRHSACIMHLNGLQNAS